MIWSQRASLLSMATVLAVTGCSNATRHERSATIAGRWSSQGCQPPGDIDIILSPDGTYVEAGGNGRWAVEGSALRVQVAQPPTIEFESMLPELMAMDADGLLTFVGPNEAEAVAGGYRKRFRRCG